MRAITDSRELNKRIIRRPYPIPKIGGGKRRAGKKNKSAEGAMVRGLRLPLILKFPKEGTLRTLEQLDGVLKETFVLLKREVDLYSGVLLFRSCSD